MTLPCSGTITAAMINTELGFASNAALSFNSSSARGLAGKPTDSSTISFSDFYCKSASDPTPWYATAYAQYEGRDTGTPNFAGLQVSSGGDDFVIWGGAGFYLKFQPTFTHAITNITVQWRYNRPSSTYHALTCEVWYWSSGLGLNSAGGSFGLAGNESIQTFNLSTSIPAGTEIWLKGFGAGDSGDANIVDYIAITSVTYA